MKVRAHVFVSGRVQGVYFRSYTQDAARNLGITGWVRNNRDGSVEAVFEGEEASVIEIVEWCRKGPPMAAVGSVDLEWQEYKGEFDDFAVTYGHRF